MATIPAGVILIWTGTHAGIPTVWQRETAFDDKHLKAWGTEDPNDTGGSNAHTHAATSHGHTLTAHTHAVVLANYSGGSGNADDNDPRAVADNHGHNSANIGGTSGGALQNEDVTWSSVNHEPPYNEVIFIKPSGGAAPISDDIIVFWNSATEPDDNFDFCDGDNGTTDLRNKYLKGATTDADAGGSGGATSHQHSITHGHTANTHTHSGTSSNQNSGSRQGNAGTGQANINHTHTISLAAGTANVSDYTKTDAGSGDTIDLVHHRLALVQNTSGASKSPKLGMIGLWLGTVANVPVGWDVCDGSNDTPDLRNKYIKVINITSEIGDTGGSNTHSHSAVSHTHAATGTHTHTGSTGTPSATASKSGQQDNGWTEDDHTHTLQSVSSQTATFSTDDLDSGSAVNHEPAYRIAAFIQLNKIFGGGFLAALMASSG